MSEVTVKVLGKITRGTVLVLSDDMHGLADRAHLFNELRRIAGHDQFVVVFDPDSRLQLAVASPDIVKQIKELLDATQDSTS